MIDGNNTTFDWQTHTGDICVLPVGSFEQHSLHLPLETDNILAEFFARMVAGELDAALLPVLPVATCLEHGGYRGSISLRPETLMQVIRDVVEEVQRQNFKILVLVNGHGGNIALYPVIRDINRRDGSLKIIIVQPWDYWTVDDPAQKAAKRFNLHADEEETSIMLAVRPDLVRPVSKDMLQDTSAFPLLQRDLNTFGSGHFAPMGAVGHPSFATAEKGKAMIDAVRKKMLPHLLERIARLRKQWRFSGSGGIAVRKMNLGDIAGGMRLSALAGWNQTEDDWELFLKNNVEGCFAAVHNGLIVGTTCIFNYEQRLAWIGLVLVDPEFRQMGIGRLLMNHALEHLKSCACVKLDASEAGKKLYNTMEFFDECELVRISHNAMPGYDMKSASGTKILPLTEEMLGRIMEMDRKIFGVNRFIVLKALLKSAPQSALCLEREGTIHGFCLGRPGANFHQIGPVVAEKAEDAKALIAAALRNLTGQPILLDISSAQVEVLSWLESLGFSNQRSFTRMYYKTNTVPGNSAQQFAIAGPELG